MRRVNRKTRDLIGHFLVVRYERLPGRKLLGPLNIFRSTMKTEGPLAREETSANTTEYSHSWRQDASFDVKGRGDQNLEVPGISGNFESFAHS